MYKTNFIKMIKYKLTLKACKLYKFYFEKKLYFILDIRTG